MQPQRYQKVLSILSRRIFSGQIKAGVKLSTELDLSKEMEVDRTSLRVALKQLELLNVLEIRQGDGIYVKDYIRYAGVDFLRVLFENQASVNEDGNGLWDTYMMDEVLEFWIEFLPLMLRLVAEKFSPRDIKSLQDLYNEQLQSITNKQRMVQIELQAHDRIAEIADNTIFRLFINSSLPLREKMMAMFYTGFDVETIRRDIEIRKELFAIAFSGSSEKITAAIERYKQMLITYRKRAREIYPNLI